MSTINGMSSILSSLSIQSTQGKPDPAEKFKELDADSNGSLDKTELSTMAKELAKMTGKTLNVDDTITTYDTNNDGALNQDEMDTMMQKMGPPTASGASMQQVMDAYSTNSGDDPLTTLMKMLDSLDTSSSSSSTSSNSSSSSDDDTMSILMKALEELSGSSTASVSRPDPEAKFNAFDSDGSGGLSKSEMDVMAKEMSSMTGSTLDTENAINSYDTNQDGELSKSEMDTMMKETMAKSGGPQQAPAANDDQTTLLRQLLDQYATNFASEPDTNVNSII